MPEYEHQRKQKASWKLMGRFVISLISVFFTHFALFLVPHFFHSSLFTLLSLSALALLAVAGFGRCCKGLLGVGASAPAFVFISLLFIWCVYIVVVRQDYIGPRIFATRMQAISSLVDIVFNAELVMLVVGLCSILLSDPGFVTCGSSRLEEHVDSVSDVEADSQSSVLVRRIRYCKYCKIYVKGFDHHCPAFGNCIGQKNHALFIVLLVGFVVSEASYIACSSQFVTKSHILDRTGKEISLSGNLAISTMLFSLLQVLWQVVFLTWHIYCVCSNIKTEEWINWKSYPEFQLIVQPQPGQQLTETRFTNPYDKGILRNLKEFLKVKG